MLSSINFLFLLSLAFISWIVLCYFKHIEDRKYENIDFEFTMEKSRDDGSTSCRGTYDIYINFLCVFACVCLLAQVIKMTEAYITKRFCCNIAREHANCVVPVETLEEGPHFATDKDNGHAMDKVVVSDVEDTTEPTTIDDYRRLCTFLRAQVAELKLANDKLKHTLMQTRNNHFNGESNMIDQKPRQGDACGDADAKDMQLILKADASPSMFFPSLNAQRNRNVFVSEGNVPMLFPSFPHGVQHRTAWHKYYAMKNAGQTLPHIISTEKLQAIYSNKKMVEAIKKLK